MKLKDPCTLERKLWQTLDNISGFFFLHHLLEFAQTHVRWVVLSSVIPFSSCFQSFSASGSFPMSQLFTFGGQSIGASAPTSVLPMNIQDWFPLWLIGLISLQSIRLSRVFSSTSLKASVLVLSLLYGPTLTSVHDFWKKYSFDYIYLCQQSNVVAF